MSTEIELKLQLNPKAARQLAAHPLLAGIPAQKQHLLNTYFDTPKLELHAKRIALRFRKRVGNGCAPSNQPSRPAAGWPCAANGNARHAGRLRLQPRG
jgi:hypothetical protein